MFSAPDVEVSVVVSLSLAFFLGGFLAVDGFSVRLLADDGMGVTCGCCSRDVGIVLAGVAGVGDEERLSEATIAATVLIESIKDVVEENVVFGPVEVGFELLAVTGGALTCAD